MKTCRRAFVFISMIIALAACTSEKIETNQAEETTHTSGSVINETKSVTKAISDTSADSIKENTAPITSAVSIEDKTSLITSDITTEDNTSVISTGHQSASFNMDEINDIETETTNSSVNKYSHQKTETESQDEETIYYGGSTLYMTHASGYEDPDEYADDYAEEYLDSGDFEDYDEAYDAAYEDFENYEDY